MTATISPTAPGAHFARRIGPHYFAHLRAVAEGLDLTDCARRYLGVEHGHEAITAHRQAVDAVRAVARQRGEIAWRLVGLSIRIPPGEASRARCLTSSWLPTAWRALAKRRRSGSSKKLIRRTVKPRAASD